jgi:hypothetical protein
MYPLNDWIDNEHGTEPPPDDGVRVCDHGKTMTEPCDDCDPPDQLSKVERVYAALKAQRHAEMMADAFNLSRR